MSTDRNWLDRLARSIMGAEPDILDRCTPQEQRYMLNKSILVAFPAIIALFSCYCAIDTVSPNSPTWVKTASALVWSSVVLAFDRAIMIQTVAGVFSLAFLVRGVMAAALSFLLTEPILQKVFADSIEQAEHCKRLQAQDAVNARFLPKEEALHKEMADCEAETNRLRRVYEVELNGTGGTRLAGSGPISIRNETMYREQVRYCDKMTASNQAQLAELEKAKAEAVKTEVDALATSLAGRLITLHELTEQNWLIAWTVWLSRIVLFCAEIMPLLLKFGRRKHRDELGEWVNDEQYTEIEIMRNQEHLQSVRKLSDSRQRNDLLRKESVISAERAALEMQYLRRLADSKRVQITLIAERQREIEHWKTETIESLITLQHNENQEKRHKQFLERMVENYQNTLMNRYLRFSMAETKE